MPPVADREISLGSFKVKKSLLAVEIQQLFLNGDVSKSKVINGTVWKLGQLLKQSFQMLARQC